MIEKNASNRYSQKTKTVEDPPMTLKMKILLGISMSTQLISGLIMLFIGIYAFTLCDAERVNDFAGLAPIFALINCLITVTSCTLVRKMKRMAVMVFGVLNFIISAVMVVYESASYRCLQESNIELNMCTELRSKLNGCQWTHAESGSGDNTPSADVFASGRLTLVLLAVITLVSSITTLIFLTIAMKMGKPVYLVLKRHKNSIVVGDAKNAEIANKNKIRNLELIEIRIQEEVAYEKKKKDRLKEYMLVRRKSSSLPDESEAAKNGSGFIFKTDKPSTQSRSNPSSTAGQISQNKSKSSDELDPSKFNANSKKNSVKTSIM